MNAKQNDHLNLLFDIGELSELVTGSHDIRMFLQQVVDLVSLHFNAPVCSIYLYDSVQDILVLKATKGLNPAAVDQIFLKPGEGLVGYSFENNRIIREGNALQHPRFKYFTEAGEDPFNSFLCLPIRRGAGRIGVLVIQHRDKNYFDQSDEIAIRTAVTQLAGAIENAKLLMELNERSSRFAAPVMPELVRGVSLVAGFAQGHAAVFSRERKDILYQSDEGVSGCTKDDFLKAVDQTQKSLKQLQQDFAARLPESAALIFTAHFMILKDKNFIGKMGALIDTGERPAQAVRKVAKDYIAIFSASPNRQIREKVADIEDLAIRILNHLGAGRNLDGVRENEIVVTRTVYPSDVLKFLSEGACGIILIGNGSTSHVTILCRSLHLPLIQSDNQDLLRLKPSDQIMMDADTGNIHINPGPDTITAFNTKEKAKRAADRIELKPVTRTGDGKTIRLFANINLLAELSLAESYHAQGIGLYRTEFPFLIRNQFPSETEQYQIYKRLLNGFGGDGPVTIRTLDAGGEKTLSYSESHDEANPDLGLRSIRFSFQYKEVFESQIKAILRASTERDNVRIMFPFISSLDEFRAAKDILSKCMAELEQNGREFNRQIKTGVMIELPAVLGTIDAFAKEADFFSIGTNDFIQYMLAADRTNAMVSQFYQACHPAVLKGLDQIARAAIHRGTEVCVCGEMAHEPEYIPFLLGIGIDTLSIDPQFFPDVQKNIEKFTLAEAVAYSKKLLKEDTIAGTRSVIDQFSSAIKSR